MSILDYLEYAENKSKSSYAQIDTFAPIWLEACRDPPSYLASEGLDIMRFASLHLTEQRWPRLPTFLLKRWSRGLKIVTGEKIMIQGTVSDIIRG